MPPILGNGSFSLLEHASAQKIFHEHLGSALGQWALVEERLSYWFEDITRMPYEMARAIFFAPRTFQARTDLLEAAITNDTTLCACAREFIKAATVKAGKLSSFRNRLAHGEQTFDTREESPTHKQVILISSRLHPEKAAADGVTGRKLIFAIANFRELAKLLMDVSEFLRDPKDPTLPVECLRRLNALPNQADLPGPGPI